MMNIEQVTAGLIVTQWIAPSGAALTTVANMA